MYLELVYNRHEAAAKRFVERYGKIQESFFQVRTTSVCNQMKNIWGCDEIEELEFTHLFYRRTLRNYLTSQNGNT